MSMTNKIAKTMIKPVVAGASAAAIIGITQEARVAEVFGYDVPFAAFVGGVVAAGSLAAELTHSYVIPMITQDQLSAYAIYILKPAWTGALAAGTDFVIGGTSEGLLMTFFAGIAGQVIAEWSVQNFNLESFVPMYV